MKSEKSSIAQPEQSFSEKSSIAPPEHASSSIFGPHLSIPKPGQASSSIASRASRASRASPRRSSVFK